MSSTVLAPTVNRLLSALPDEELGCLLADLRPVAFPAKSLVFDADEPITSVFFPLDLVVSLVTPVAEGVVEVATIAKEGIVGVPFVDGAPGAVRALTPVRGLALAMEAPTFLVALDRWETFR